MNFLAWRYYSKFYQPYYYRLVLIVFSLTLRSISVIPIALIIRYLFDSVIPHKHYFQLIFIGVGLFIFRVVDLGFSLWIKHKILKTNTAVIEKLRIELLKKFYAFSRSYYSQADLNELHTLIVQDTKRLDTMSHTLISKIIPELLIAIFLSILLFNVNWSLFLILIAVIPFVYLLSKYMSKKVQYWVTSYQESFKAFKKGIFFVLHNMDLTRIQAGEDYEIARQKVFLAAEKSANINLCWINSIYGVVQNLVITFAGIVLLIVGGLEIIEGHMTVGKILLFLFAANILKNSFFNIINAMPDIIDGNESLKDLFKIIKIDDMKPYNENKKINFQGEVIFNNVSFSYQDNKVISNAHLKISKQETVAIVGTNGAGKSTITYLLLGFYRPDKGQIYADEYPLDILDISDLRRQIGVVTQEATIIAGTILENITYGIPDANLGNASAAAKLSTADDFIQNLPNAYDTLVGERGILLSGGQRQKIAIARALVRQPKLLILDEPTNHLDRGSVITLMKNLKQLEPIPTILIISHDDGIIQEADSVYSLENGCLVPMNI
ncbi:MAG TPA: ABC transporter ATP-binding protein [Oculatellaceae cyanobacterium]|jgi:ABC-type bacteriocin/lantibiotic exporter with double-glycine peptidase domain